MFAHTHRRSLSLLLTWTSVQAASILLTLSTPSTLKNPCMCHSQEHSQKPRAVSFSKMSPVKVGVCLYYEKPMEINTLSINIVYSSTSDCFCWFTHHWIKCIILLLSQIRLWSMTTAQSNDLYLGTAPSFISSLLDTYLSRQVWKRQTHLVSIV